MTRVPDFEWKREDAGRWQAMYRDPAMRIAIMHLCELVCAVNQVPFHPGQGDLSAFDAGRQWVGRQIGNALMMSLEERRVPDERDDHRPLTATERAARHAPRGGTGGPTGSRG